MLDAGYERINDCVAVKISLASPNDIRSWSYGEVKKPETINYRTYRAEKDGLFCERIFGPERDWECFCGKYKGMKHKGMICDRCGVTVTHSRVRRKRMGHINLAAPVVHIWFFKAMPSRLAGLLGMKSSDLDRVVYFQDYVVVNPGDTPLKKKQLLTEDDYRQAVEEYGEGKFQALMGAEAVRRLLAEMDLAAEAAEMRTQLEETKSKQKIKDLSQRLKLIESLRQAPHNRAEWMVLEVVPVIPPDLRPLVLLESGNFATSDLNDLYRRIINRNNRLKKLVELNAPEVIIRNEKRMLQQSVDALMDNGRCKRPVLGSSNRPLKSLTDMIKGKQGRFRENLLGKRVDYSGRSVIVVGPEFRLHQCGLPKKIALELFQPFIIRRLKELGHADTIKSAKKMLERKEELVWDILEEVIREHPVLLNRAPTLHRMGIQAFEPVLIEGNAIKIHPLVCKGFNADFDGDQMAVHLPLSIEAQVEAATLMLSTNNIFSPASGKPIITPTQDIVLGTYYMTTSRPGMKGEGMAFDTEQEVHTALAQGKTHLHAQVWYRAPAGRVVLEGPDRPAPADRRVHKTSVGRILFNHTLPDKMPFYNYTLSQSLLNGVIADSHRYLGRAATVQLLDEIKTLGFRQATLAGVSFATDDLRLPQRKEAILGQIQKQVEKIQKDYARGAITDGERHNQVVDAWTHARELVTAELMDTLKNDTRDGKPVLNPIWMMVDSGARGSVEQVRQLAGMRGLMAKPSGEIIETPIKANFREGLGVLEYFSSTHGARKGLADTALKTADSGYLTRKLADVAQNVVVTQPDCGTARGVTKEPVYEKEKVAVSLAQLITGRVARDSIVNPVTDEVVVAENELITNEKARRIEEMGIPKIRVRSPLTCDAAHGVCAKCYGMDLSTGMTVEEGMAVGIIAAQSIGEPGTQLTMRTFHIGGVAYRRAAESELRAKQGGVVRYERLEPVQTAEGDVVVLGRTGEIQILDQKGRVLDTASLPAGAFLQVKDGQTVQAGAVLVRWDPHNRPILAVVGGRVRFEDIREGETVREEVDPKTGHARRFVVEHKGDLHPQIVIEDAEGKILQFEFLPEKAYIEVEAGDEVRSGHILAKVAREMTGTQDITGGLPRVTELFEARKPKDPAVMSEIDGIVQLGERRRGKRTILVKSESGVEREHLVPYGKGLRVHTGDRVRAGDALTDGPLVPHDILRISGEEALQQYLLREVQSVYRAQDVTIDDKHIETIISQMLRRLRVSASNDTGFLPGEVVDKFLFRQRNEQLRRSVKVVEPGDSDYEVGQVVPAEEFKAKGAELTAAGKTAPKSVKPKPGTARPLLLGITKASLQGESFLSAASFQETTKVLTEAALAGKVDRLLGLKENVILGRLVPAGTGFKRYSESSVRIEESALREVQRAEAAEAEATEAEAALTAGELLGAKPTT
jgi:DNA-directed RNA polymerase subunit beta'